MNTFESMGKESSQRGDSDGTTQTKHRESSGTRLIDNRAQSSLQKNAVDYR